MFSRRPLTSSDSRRHTGTLGFITRASLSFIVGISALFLLAAGYRFEDRNAGAGHKEERQTPLPQEAYTISDNVDLVLLDVNVKRPHGGYVSGLGKDNFAVFEDGQRRAISQFASVDTPVTVGLIVDNSGSMRLKRPEVVQAGLAFARESNSADEFFVINFNNQVIRGLPDRKLFTDNLQQLRKALYFGQPAGQTALYDAIEYGIRHLEFSHQDKRTLIVVSDGGDNVSKSSFAELMRMIEASRATIYTVGLFDPNDPDANPAILRKIAAVSGGEFFQPATLDDVVPVFHRISQDVRNSYMIGYTPDETNDRRLIRTVKVVAQESGKRLAVHTRTTYLVKPAELVSAESARSHE